LKAWVIITVLKICWVDDADKPYHDDGLGQLIVPEGVFYNIATIKTGIDKGWTSRSGRSAP
jgi:hypothetical protein